MIPVSFMTANYCARHLKYNMTEGWVQGERATSAHFQPIATFAGRFEAYLSDIRSIGFDAIDLWLPIVDPKWVTDAHIDAALDLLRQYDLSVYTVVGWLGSTPDEFVAVCELASAFGAPVLAGGTTITTRDYAFTVDTLKKYGLRLAIENHPEKSAAEMMAKVVGGGDGTIGTTVDTGWYGTQGVDAAGMIEQLGQHVFHVHLKDVREVGQHNTCRYGEGIVPIRRCVEALKAMNYGGTISVEHEPEHFDPTEDVRASLALLQEWLAE